MLLLAHAAVWLACGGVGGERAMTGTCPEGEVCSPIVDGLTFHGGSTYDRLLWMELLPTAVGGTQTFSYSADVPVDALATSSDPAVLAVDAQVEHRYVTLRALRAGRAYLRVVDGSDRLLDRIELEAVEVDRVELRAGRSAYSAWDGPWAFHRGGTAQVVLALLDGEGGRLVDESASLADESAEPLAWDAARVSLDRAGDVLTLGVDAGGMRWVASAPLVDGVDRLEPSSLERASLLRAPSLTVGEESALCFLAFAGDLPVAGVPFEVASTGGIAAEPLEGDSGELCARVQALAEGRGEVVLRAGAVEGRRAVQVTR